MYSRGDEKIRNRSQWSCQEHTTICLETRANHQLFATTDRREVTRPPLCVRMRGW